MREPAFPCSSSQQKAQGLVVDTALSDAQALQPESSSTGAEHVAKRPKAAIIVLLKQLFAVDER